MNIKDSGERREFSTGSVRDTSAGKGRCDLLPLGIIGSFGPDNVLHYIEEYIREGDLYSLWTVIKQIQQLYYPSLPDLLLDVSKQYEDGAKKYEPRNWEKGQPLSVYIDSGVRHYLKHLAGKTDEPHLRAFVWNILGAMWTHWNLPEMIDLPFREGSLKKLVGEGHIEKNIEDLRDIVSIQDSDGNWNANEYMLGLYNGLVLALATIEGKEPIFRELPGGARG